MRHCFDGRGQIEHGTLHLGIQFKNLVHQSSLTSSDVDDGSNSRKVVAGYQGERIRKIFLNLYERFAAE